jgi:hypothetical protein
MGTNTGISMKPTREITASSKTPKVGKGRVGKKKGGQKMAKAAFLTYNSVGNPGSHVNGWVASATGHAALIVQHPRGKRWGTGVGIVGPGKPYCLDQARNQAERDAMLACGAARKALVASIYAPATGQFDINDIDYLVVYVGAGGSEGAIELATRLPAEKLRFVLCRCNLSGKLEMIESCCGRVPYLICECGGQATMERLFKEFLRDGTVGPH